MECTCYHDMCVCIGGCCVDFCGSPACEHDTYECICKIMCDFCKLENLLENLMDDEVQNLVEGKLFEELSIHTSMKRKSYEDDAYDDEVYDADDDSDDADDGESEYSYSEHINIPLVKKIRVN